MKLCYHLKRPAPRRKPLAGWNSRGPRMGGAVSNNVPKDTRKPMIPAPDFALNMARNLIALGRMRGRG